MPSPCKAKGGFYLRKGGAWKQTKNGQMKYVGYGKGTHSRRDPVADSKRKAKRGTAKQRARYSNHYD